MNTGFHHFSHCIDNNHHRNTDYPQPISQLTFHATLGIQVRPRIAILLHHLSGQTGVSININTHQGNLSSVLNLQIAQNSHIPNTRLTPTRPIMNHNNTTFKRPSVKRLAIQCRCHQCEGTPPQLKTPLGPLRLCCI